MIGRKSLVVLALCWLCSGTLAQDDNAAALRQRALKKELGEAKTALEKAARRIRDLKRLRIARDLLVPVEEAELLLGTKAELGGTAKDLKARLDKESNRTRRLRERLDGLLSRAGGDPSAVLPPAAPGGVATTDKTQTSTPTAIETAPKLPVVRVRKNRPSVIGRDETQMSFISPTHEPSVKDPLTLGGTVRLRLHSAPSPVKRIRSLLDAGLAREALAILPKLVEEHGETPMLVFLKAQALELAGVPKQAKAEYERVIETDSAQKDGEESVLGPWAQAAKTALAHMDWRSATEPLQLPDLGKISW